MLRKIKNIFSITVILCCGINVALAGEQAQAILDEACEAAREVALIPQREKIYLRCRNTYSETHERCMSDALKYNGNRNGDIPLHYDLPACYEATDYREEKNKKLVR